MLPKLGVYLAALAYPVRITDPLTLCPATPLKFPIETPFPYPSLRAMAPLGFPNKFLTAKSLREMNALEA
jgi:hypothetical protein